MDISAHEVWFAEYAARFRSAEEQRSDGDVRPLLLKEEHTAAVLRHARLLVDTEKPGPLVARACLLAALYHDVARFPQYSRWRTFKDSLSANHGLLGVSVLKQEARLVDEHPQVRALVLAAVGMHNRFSVPEGIAADLRLVTDMVRDADKLDIFRIMAEHLGGPGPYSDTVILSVRDEPAQWTPKVVQDALAGRVASYADLRFINDFRLLLGTWIFDLRFAATRRRLAASGLVVGLLAPLPDAPLVQEARSLLLQRLDSLCA